MAVSFQIEDGHGTERRAVVTKFGEIASGQLHYSSSSSVNVDVVNTAYNMVPPRHQQEHIIITGIVLTANKNVGTSDARVILYCNGEGPTSRTQEIVLVETEIAKNDTFTLNPVAIEILPGKWVNVETDDDDIFVTLLYYYVEEFE
tara:strand:- start:225 stop:662 length:438 start_codon:yes stop_codon:yes gene_type:complete